MSEMRLDATLYEDDGSYRRVAIELDAAQLYAAIQRYRQQQEFLPFPLASPDEQSTMTGTVGWLLAELAKLDPGWEVCTPSDGDDGHLSTVTAIEVHGLPPKVPFVILR